MLSWRQAVGDTWSQSFFQLIDGMTLTKFVKVKTKTALNCVAVNDRSSPPSVCSDVAASDSVRGAPAVQRCDGQVSGRNLTLPSQLLHRHPAYLRWARESCREGRKGPHPRSHCRKVYCAVSAESFEKIELFLLLSKYLSSFVLT